MTGSAKPATQGDLFSVLPLSERVWVLRALREETVGGALLLAAAALAMLWANSPWGDAYAALTQYEVGPEALHLHLTLEEWAADGLLAVFFFVAGLELKHELTHGSLSEPAKAAVPVAAAVGGMVVPAAIYAAVNLGAADGAPAGWGIPMATDIAFALAVLAVVGRNLPVALRAFLLTLAVTDDLGAIVVIALFYSKGFEPLPLVAAVVLLIGYWWAQRKGIRSPLLYVPLAFAIWFAVHSSGVHATVAGVAMGLLTSTAITPGETTSQADRLQAMIQPISAGVCVPIFAFMAAGVDLRGIDVAESLAAPVSIGIMLGLVVGKPIGVLGGAWLTARFTRAHLSAKLAWRDVAAIGLIAGIGFTVSLLITELAFYQDADRLEGAKFAVLLSSVLAAALASVALLWRSRVYAEIYAEQERDDDRDGVPDVYGR